MGDVSRENVVAGLRALGARSGDTLFVHSSLKSFGRVAGGAGTVVDSLVDAVGEGGTVVVPTHTTNTIDGADREGEMAVAFDVSKTESMVGIVTETLRRRPGARRSSHPTHSVAALGPGAAEITANHGPTPFGADGPYGAMRARNALILLLGSPIGRNTTLHAIEQWMGMPYMGEVRSYVATPGGPELVDVPLFPSGDRGFYQKRARIHDIHESAGIIVHGRVGAAELKAVRVKDLIRVTAEAELEFAGVLLCERPDCIFCTKGRAAVRAKSAEIRRNIQALLTLADSI